MITVLWHWLTVTFMNFIGPLLWKRTRVWQRWPGCSLARVRVQPSRDEVCILYSHSRQNNNTEIIRSCSTRKTSARLQPLWPSGFAMFVHRKLQTILHHNSHLLRERVSSHRARALRGHCGLSAQIQTLKATQLQICHRYVSLFCMTEIKSYVSLEHKSSHKQHMYICGNIQQYIVWVKIIKCSFMPKIIRILRSCSMKI